MRYEFPDNILPGRIGLPAWTQRGPGSRSPTQSRGVGLPTLLNRQAAGSCCGANQAMSVATKALESEGARAYIALVRLGISVWHAPEFDTSDNVSLPKLHRMGKRQSRRFRVAGGFAV